MLSKRIQAYAGLGHQGVRDKLAQDLRDPVFFKVAMATFGTEKYFLSADQFKKHLALAPTPPGSEPLSLTSEVWNRLTLLSSRAVTGNAARDVLQAAYDKLDVDGREVVMMILDKTWRVGVTADTINSVRPGTFRPAKFMLAHNIQDRLDKGKVTWPMLATYKYDGYRAIYCMDTRRALSRNGNQFPLTEALAGSLTALSHALKNYFGLDYAPAIDGELFAGSWKATAEARSTGYDQMYVFGHLRSELIYGGAGEAFNVVEFLDVVDEICDRLQLEELATPERKLVSNVEEMEAYYQQALAEGYEGLVLTSIVRPYEGKRSYHWLKRKPADPIDVVVTGAKLADERSKFAGLIGAIEVEYQGKRSFVTGMSDALRAELTELWKAGHLAGLVAEVVIHELTPDGFLRHGRIKTIRTDKPAGEC